MESVLHREYITNKTASRVLGIFVFGLLTALGAFVRIPLPFTPVPITLQTFFVLLSGLALGECGLLSQALYVVLGIGGVPLFANAGSGLSYLIGPTGGYLIGFILASYSVGMMIKALPRVNFFSVCTCLCLADVILLGAGTLWIKTVFGCSLAKSLLIGFVPFIPGDMVKILVASSVFVKVHSRLKAVF